MLVPPVVSAMSRPCSMRAGATTLLNAQNGRRMYAVNRVHAIEAADLSRVVMSEARILPMTTPTVESLNEEHVAAYGLPADTGGLDASGSVSGSAFFKQLARELASTYLLSFEPAPTDRDGQPHRIEVRTSRRPAPTIRARKTFIAPVTMASRRPEPQTAAPVETASVESERVSRAPETSPLAGTAPAGSAVPLLTVLQRSAVYVDSFERTLSTVVAEERYVQVVKLWAGDAPKPRAEPELAWKPGQDTERSRSASHALRRRQLLSDLLLVQPPGQMWIGYRDVAEVDGTPVRDRASRVKQLFLSPKADSRSQLQRIADESARHNLGPSRNINVPTFPLQILRAGNVGRFEWTSGAQSRQPTDPPGCTVVGFRETTEPTIVKTNRGRIVPITGQFCIDPDSGRVWRATLKFWQPVESVEGAFMVTFRASSEVSVLLPDQAWEWSRSSDPERGNRVAYVEGLASYSNPHERRRSIAVAIPARARAHRAPPAVGAAPSIRMTAIDGAEALGGAAAIVPRRASLRASHRDECADGGTRRRRKDSREAA